MTTSLWRRGALGAAAGSLALAAFAPVPVPAAAALPCTWSVPSPYEADYFSLPNKGVVGEVSVTCTVTMTSLSVTPILHWEDVQVATTTEANTGQSSVGIGTKTYCLPGHYWTYARIEMVFPPGYSPRTVTVTPMSRTVLLDCV